MASKAKTREAIHAAFARLERVAEESGLNAHSMFHKAHNAALDSERAHRRYMPSRPSLSVETAARYFVVKWFLDPGKVTDARSAASLRLDCLYASALRGELQHEMGTDPAFTTLLGTLAPVASIDYATDIMGAK